MAYAFDNKTDLVDQVMAAHVNALQDALEAHEFLTLKAATELTISSGAIVVTQAAHKLQPESGTTDDLTDINGMDAGDVLVLLVSDAGTDTITVKHGTGNISCVGGSDVAISEGAAIFYYDGTTVFLIGGGGGGGGISNVVEDTTPQLGGDLDMQQHSLVLPAGEPTSDDTGVGIKEAVTVDTNSVGISGVLCLSSDGNYDEADADSITTMKGLVLALETGTGSKQVLHYGKFRHDAWNWTPGAILYVSTTPGTLTKTAPTGEDDVIKAVAIALTDDCIFWNPTETYITHAA